MWWNILSSSIWCCQKCNGLWSVWPLITSLNGWFLINILLFPHILHLSSSYIGMNSGILMFWWSGYAIASLGPGNGWDSSAITAVSSGWIPHLQYRKPVIPLGQCCPIGYTATCSKYAGCSKNLTSRCPSCAHRTTLRRVIHAGICTHCLPRGAHKNLDETWDCWHPIQQFRTLVI